MATDIRNVTVNGLSAIEIESGSRRALIYRHGAHVAAFSNASGELLWLSREAVFKAGKAIRGGVPLCFPWFGDNTDNPSLPAHGFARTREWELASATQVEDGAVVEFSLESSPETLALWPHRFRARYRVHVGNRLTLTFAVENLDDSPFTYELALHSYYRVGDVQRARLQGLAGARYDDKVTGSRGVLETETELRFSGETDRVYASDATVTVEDPARGRRVTIDKQGSASTVVWNPWTEKAARLKDFGDDEWPEMLCVEAGNIGDGAVTLAPGARHATTATAHVSDALGLAS